MSELQVIESALEKAARRRRWGRALRGLWRGLLVGAVISLVSAGLYHVLPVPLWMLILAVAAPPAGMLVGLVIGGWRKPPLEEVARWVDDRQRLKERLSTALEISNEATAGRWRDLVMADAAAHAKALDPRKLLPYRLSRATRWSAVLLALCAGLAFVPEYRSKAYLQKKADQQNIQDTGRQLAQLTKQNLEKRPPALEPTQKALESVGQLGDQLANKVYTRPEALKDLANVAEKLKEQLKDMGKDPGMKKLEQAARSGGGSDSQSPSGMQKQLEQAQKEMGAANASPEAIEKLKKDLEKLAESAAGMADKNAPGSEAEKQKLSESLAALSKQAEEMGLNLPDLEGAIDALAANKPEKYLKDISASLKDLEKMKQMAKSMQQLREQMEKLGKDLAEQLDKGQADAARSTLGKMMEQLKSANLTPEQLKQMMNEVSKAVNPAKEYGKVAEHLNKASQQMNQGDKSGASESLAAAAKELEKMMQEAQDAEEIMATLEALNQASQCIGTGQGWRAGKRPGYKPGGQPGSGVGTWADDNGAWNGENTGGWDNSGVNRPDMDPRGQTSRPEGSTEELTPSKVKGQYSPGGPMPSITLKGVNIKGESKIAYEDTGTAAQGEGQSALTQEKVPRAYQGTVKDYFDDVKK